MELDLQGKKKELRARATSGNSQFNGILTYLKAQQSPDFRDEFIS